MRIRGVVTYYDLAHGDFFVQDATGAMYILPPAGLAVRAGQYVEVEGISRVAEFASEVFEARIRVLSERRLPPPLGVSAEELASGAYDCQRIEVEGVVRAANSYQGGLSLDVTAGAVQFKAYVPNTALVPAELVDARVHIRGTCGGFYNRKDQFIALQVMVPTLADIRIAEPAPGNQFTAPARSIRSILRATPNRGYRHRVRVQGVVTLQRLGRSLFIRDDSVGLLVKTRQLTALHVGDRVDVAGFPALGDYAPILQDAIFQRIGTSAPLVPVTVTAPEAWLGSFDAELIRISARLIESSQGSGQRSLVLEAGNINFRAEIEEAAGRKLAGLENGSLLQLTGICSVQVDENRAASSFLLLLRSAGDVVVLEQPSWWTAKHALRALGSTGAMSMSVLMWVVALRRRVRRQTETIRRRFESEAALQQRFEYVARATNDAVWDRDLITNEGWWGDSFYKLFGYAPAEVEPDAAWWADHVHPDDRGRFVSGINAAIESCEEHWSSEYRCRRSDGSYAFVYDRGYVLRDASGKPLRMIGALMDISALKRTEQALRESQERFSAFMDNSPALAFMKDASGNYVYANRPLELLLKAKMLGKTAFDWIPADVAKEYRKHDLSVLSTGKATEFIESIPTPDGDWRDLLIFKFPVVASGQQFLGAVAVDVTEHKRAEAELLKAKEVAEAANRSKSEFVANMSHEIRTPMNGILGMVGLALGTELTPEQKEYLGIVQSSADALLIVINDILDFSKIEAGKLDLDSIEFNLQDSLKPTLTALGVRAHEKGLGLNCHIHPGVPKMLAGDPGRLRQIVINLVGNAIKFTERGEVVLSVEEERRTKETTQLHFRVRDTGIGIASEKQASIFAPFTQGDGTTARRYGGTGLGLTISRRLVEMMGGRIWMESAVGQGTTFHFTADFGLGKLVEVSLPAESDIPAPLPAVVGGSTLRILLAEDNVVNQKLAVRLLEKHGYAVIVRGNGRDALAAVETERFDLVLMDVQMPEMDGIEATIAIRKRERTTGGHLPIIAMTAHAMKGDQELCLQSGMDAYVTKPISASELFAAIEKTVKAVNQPHPEGVPSLDS